MDGRITRADIEVSGALARYADKSRELDSVNLIKSYSVDRDFLLEVNGSAVPLLRKESVKAQLESLFGGRVWVTKSRSSIRQLVEDLVHPLTVSALSTLWLPDGSKVSKAEIGSRGRRAEARLNTVQKLVKAARGIDLLFDYKPHEGHVGNVSVQTYAETAPQAVIAH